MNTANAIRVILIIGLLLALVGAFIDVPYAAFLLIVLGLTLGFLGVGDPDPLMYLVMTVGLATVVTALDGVPEIGSFLTAILANVRVLISAAAVVVIGKILASRIRA